MNDIKKTSLKIHVILIIISMICETLWAKPKVALILSGGGARGFAQIGAIKAFEEYDIKPDLIVAVSMGATIGGLYACGYDSKSITDFIKSVDWNNIFYNASNRRNMLVEDKSEPHNYLYEMKFAKDLTPIWPKSISYGQVIFDLIAPQVSIPMFNAKMNYNNLPIPLRIVSTDIITGKMVVFSNGNLAQAIRASCGVPLAFSPIKTDNMLLVDGGISANIPVSIAIKEKMDYIIVVDVTSPLWKKEDIDNPIKLFDQLIAIGVTHKKNIEKNLADLIITPKLDGIHNTNFSNIDTIINRGYVATKAYIPQILNFIERSSNTNKKHINNNSGIIIKNVKILGNEKTHDNIILKATEISCNDTITTRTIKKAMNALYATGLFKNVNIDIDSNRVLRIIVDEKPYLRTRFGLRFDEFNHLEGYLQPAYENLFGLGIQILAHLQYGAKREKYAISLKGNRLFSSKIANKINLQTYISRETVNKQTEMLIHPDSTDSNYTIILQKRDLMTLRKAGISAMIGTQIGRTAMLDGGFRIEKFKIHKSSLGAWKDPISSFRQGLRYIMLRFTIDNIDRYPFPYSGQKHVVSVGGASSIIGGTENFIDIKGKFGGFFTLNKKHTLSPQIQFAWANKPLDDIERVYLGGIPHEQKYRDIAVYNYIPFTGLRPRDLSGDILFLFRTSYRLEIQKNVFFSTRVNWGAVWDSEEFTISRSLPEDFIDKSIVGIGIGLSAKTPVGPIMLSWGRTLGDKIQNLYGLNQENILYFSAGYDF